MEDDAAKYPPPGNLANLVAPVGEMELEDDVEEMKRFLDERIRPLLAEDCCQFETAQGARIEFPNNGLWVQAVKAAIRCRSNNMLSFVSTYLRDANIDLRATVGGPREGMLKTGAKRRTTL
eukprot:5049351-Pyramimonas_sp.AAC.1